MKVKFLLSTTAKFKTYYVYVKKVLILPEALVLLQSMSKAHNFHKPVFERYPKF